MLNQQQNRLCIRVLAFLLLWSSSGPVSAENRLVETKAGPIKVETFAKGLDYPWSLAFLPDGRMLVSERTGNLRIVSADGEVSEPVAGVPKVAAGGQGGLLGIALDPQFASNGIVYLAFAEPGADGSSTAVARGKLTDAGLQNVKVIFRQVPKVGNTLHLGSRLRFSPDGKLFITTGERFLFDPAQDLSNHLGKVLRINPDGSVPEDNPFLAQKDAQPEIWSYGHRHVQGAAIHPETGKLWTVEFGPGGGDELNIPKAGANHGWPIVSWGDHYDGRDIADPPTHPEFADAIYHWTPVISPSGMTFYTGDAFPDWKGDLLIGGLSSMAIVKLALDGEKVTGEERIAMGARIRDVAQGPDGAIYVLTDSGNGEILRLSPEKSPQ